METHPLLLMFFFIILVLFFHHVADSTAIGSCDQCHRTKERDITKSRICNYPDEKDVDIIATYSDVSGHIRLARLKMRDLSDSWVWESPTNANTEHQNNSQGGMESLQTDSILEDNLKHATDERYPEETLVHTPHS
ncbi:galacturonosyltransferase 3-like, partial [Trifolium medium]|nr:galacturonosyltransferase 3-like [Trifolium medium]